MPEYSSVLLGLALVNIIGFVLMGFDKLKAKLGQWRIRERTLLGLALLFGSFGVYSGLRVFKHKTQHKSFTVTLPILMLLQSGLLLWVLVNH